MEDKKKVDEIIILAMGPTWCLCPPEAPPDSEIWACNTMYRNTKVDRIYLMHDIKYDLLLQDRDFLENINSLDIPVYTAGAREEIKRTVAYPLQEVMGEFKMLFFLNVISYMIAHAVMYNPRHIKLYGVDMRTDSGAEYNKNEKGCVEFWLGVAVGRGITWSAPKESYLCRRTIVSNFYGFKQRAAPSGVTQLIPSDTRKIFSRYKMIPMDVMGREFPEHSIMTEFGKESAQTGAVSDGTIK